jgi:hypothetical protein
MSQGTDAEIAQMFVSRSGKGCLEVSRPCHNVSDFVELEIHRWC